MATVGRDNEILDRMMRVYTDARVELRHRNAFELLIATILSAQCTDARVNAVTERLFTEYPDPEAFVAVDREVLEAEIRSTGFFRRKARSIKGCCSALVERHGSAVPDRIEDLVKLPGVGRKTANVVLAVGSGIPGIAVDTHCRRVSRRLDLTGESSPEAVERDLMGLFPEDRWADITRLFIWHGRYTCKARAPACDDCGLADLCPWWRDPTGERRERTGTEGDKRRRSAV